MKKIIIQMFLIFFFTTFIVACTKKTLYLTPEVHGYIYNSITKKPVSNTKVIMGFNGLTDNNAPSVLLNKEGEFVIPAVTTTYYYLKPNVRKYSAPPEIYISTDYYQSKILDYSNFYGKQVPEERSGYSYFNKIDVGIIYLDPEK